MSSSGVTIRPPLPDDWQRVIAVMPAWWGGRDLRELLPRVFFEHFRTTSFIVEHEDELVAFLVGFLCPTHEDEAYIHFVGVHPDWRRSRLASDLYGRFCGVAQRQGRTVVRAVTSHVNKDSVAFHTRLGFRLLPGDAEMDGLPVHLEPWTTDGVVHFELRLDPLAAVGEAQQ